MDDQATPFFASCSTAPGIVTFPAGGPTDVIARNVARKLAEAIRQPIVVENRGGANGIIGMEAVAKAEPDGYTLVFTVDSTLTANQALYRKLPYNPQKDFAPVSVAASLTTFVLAVHPSVPADTLQKFRELAAAKPSEFALNKGFWYAILAPAATPENVIVKLNGALGTVLATKDLRDALAKVGVETLGTTPAEARVLIETDTKRWAEVIKANRISLD